MSLLDTWRGSRKPQGVRAFMGWGGLAVTDESVDILDMLRAYMDRAAQESCGQCFPCRSGLKQIAGILKRLCAGEGGQDELNRLQELAELVYASARCDLGQTAPQPLLDVLAHAPEQLRARVVSPGDYVDLLTAPCISACPSHVNIPDYLEKIRWRQFDKGLASVMRDCALPGTIGRVCVRPCESRCKRKLVDVPLAIRHLKRFLADEDVRERPRVFPKKASPGSTKAAIVGAGPAGLACAYYLAQQGIGSTIFEMQEEAGGMARFGIPAYRLPRPLLAREVEVILSAGCDLRYGIAIGRDLSLADLEKQGYEAVFVGAGAPESTRLHCEGEDACYKGFMSGVCYLAEAARGRQPLQGKRLLVIGGGNVAMDCVRTGLRHGFTDVQLLYRRSLREMPADQQEIDEAQEEGVVFNYLVAPVKILAENSQVTGLVCQKMKLGEPDASGRRRPVPVENGLFELACDAIIPAIGQSVAVDVVLKGLDGGLSRWNSLEADLITGKADGLDAVFGGGDCVTGPDTLIAALAAGKRAARHIAEHLSGRTVTVSNREKLERLVAQMGVLDESEPAPFRGISEALPIRTLSPEERIRSFDEVEFGATALEAVQEAERCLRCFRVALAAF